MRNGAEDLHLETPRLLECFFLFFAATATFLSPHPTTTTTSTTAATAATTMTSTTATEYKSMLNYAARTKAKNWKTAILKKLLLYHQFGKYAGLGLLELGTAVAFDSVGCRGCSMSQSSVL